MINIISTIIPADLHQQRHTNDLTSKAWLKRWVNTKIKVVSHKRIPVKATRKKNIMFHSLQILTSSINCDTNIFDASKIKECNQGKKKVSKCFFFFVCFCWLVIVGFYWHLVAWMKHYAKTSIFSYSLQKLAIYIFQHFSKYLLCSTKFQVIFVFVFVWTILMTHSMSGI